MLALLPLAPTGAFAAVLKQDNHQRFVFSEDYSGYYVMSYTMLGLDKVRFEACEATGSTSANCKFLAELSYQKLNSLKGPMLEMLRKYRAEVDEKKNGFWMFFSRGGMKSRDLEAIDQMIAEIENDGLGHLVLLTDENIGKDSPKMTTPEFARELTARMKTVLESGAPMGVVDCIPYLRRQGL
jgi:hypothetical protein